MSGALATVREKATKTMNKAKSAVGMSVPEENNTLREEVAEMCPQLTFRQRMAGFGTCFALGWIISLTSFNYFEELIAGKPVPFVVVYTVGNVISIISSLFLCGPKRQFKRMFDDKRKITTTVYLSTLLLALIVCFIPFNSDAKLAILVILLLSQFVASLWYTLSYIPFARRAVLNCFRREFGDENVV